MDLAVLVDCGDSRHGPPVEVASEQHDTRTDVRGVPSITERRPAQLAVVLGVEIDSKIDVEVRCSPPGVAGPTGHGRG